MLIINKQLMLLQISYCHVQQLDNKDTNQFIKDQMLEKV